jgi:hypothetical protein
MTRIRQRGAQPGNTNRVKTGFYSKRFNGDELDDLEIELREGLTDEIALMRVMMRRVLDAADGETEKKDLIDTLATLGTSSTRLSLLMRAQAQINNHQTDIANLIIDAIEEVANANHLGDRFTK